MKIAIICSGYLRSFKSNIIKLKELLLDRYDCDLYLYIISNEYESDKYINRSYNWKEMFDTIKPKVYIVENSDYISNTLKKIEEMWYKIYMCNCFIKSNKLKDNIKYDRVIRIRPDLLLSINLETIDNLINDSKNTIIFPSYPNKSYPNDNLDNFNGINDQFAIGPTNLMNIYSDLYLYIKKYNENNIYNSTSLLYYHLIDNNINFKEYEFNTKLILKENTIITLSGDSGSGKSTFSKKLKTFIESKKEDLDILIYECDRYHKWERENKHWNTFTHLNPNANYIDKMKDDILQLKINSNILQVDYDHNNGKFTKPDEIKPSSIIIVSGLHTLLDNTLKLMSQLRIYLDPLPEIKIKCKIERDKIERGYSEDKILSSIEKRLPDYYKYIEPQKNNSDIIISYISYDPCLVKIIFKEKTIEFYDEINLFSFIYNLIF